MSDDIRTLMYKAMQEIPAKERLKLFMDMIDQLSPLERKALAEHLHPKHRAVVAEPPLAPAPRPAEVPVAAARAPETPIAAARPAEPPAARTTAPSAPRPVQMPEPAQPRIQASPPGPSVDPERMAAEEMKKLMALSGGGKKKMRSELFSCIGLGILVLAGIVLLAFTAGSLWDLLTG